MLTETYIAAVLADPDQAYAIWMLWAAGEIESAQAELAWLAIVVGKGLPATASGH